MPDFSLSYETDTFRIGYGPDKEPVKEPVAGEPSGIPQSWMLAGGVLVIGIVLVMLLK